MAPEPMCVFTDGACIGNPGPGGWAWALDDAHYASGAEGHTTNQRMELTAALEAVRAFSGPIEIVSDSTYVVNCFRDRWWEGWRRRGWRNSKGVAVANQDLWEPLVSLVVDDRPGEVGFRWVKGHAADRMNNFVDSLANAAARSGAGVSAGTDAR
jgi:ribonuclease HI